MHSNVDYNQAYIVERSSIKTVIGPNKKIIEVAANQPAIEHDPITGEELGLRLSPPSTNFFPVSHAWNAMGGQDGTSDITEMSGVSTPIDGLTSCARVVKHVNRGAADDWYQYRSVPTTWIGPHTFTFHFLPVLNVGTFGSETSNSQHFAFRYTIATGEVTIGGNTKSAEVTPLDDGWYRCTVTSKESPGASDSFVIIAWPDDTTSGEGEFWTTGYNVERGSRYTGLIPTDGGEASRGEDRLYAYVADQDNSELQFNPNKGTWIIDADLDGIRPFPTSGYAGLLTGSGKVVLTYSGSMARVFVNGEMVLDTDFFVPGIPFLLLSVGMATVRKVTYIGRKLAPAAAKARATGSFEITLPVPVEGSDGKRMWFNPANKGTMFDRWFGRYGVLDDWDSVGLMLDLSEGGPGPNKVPNPDFSVGTMGWTGEAVGGHSACSTFYVENNTLFFGKEEGLEGYCSLSLIEPLTVEGNIPVMFSCNLEAEGQIDIRVGTTPGATNVFFTTNVPTNGKHRAVAFFDPEGHTELYITLIYSGDVPATIKNATLREVPGNHLYQEDNALRVFYRTDGVRHWLEGDDVAGVGGKGLLNNLATKVLTLSEFWGVSYATQPEAYYNYGGPWRFLGEGLDGSAAGTNRIEEYWRANADRVIYSRYQGQGEYTDRLRIMPPEGTDIVAWANHHTEESAVGEIYENSDQGEVLTGLPYSLGTATFHIFQGYAGDFQAMRLYGFVVSLEGWTTEERKRVNEYLRALAEIRY